MPFYEYECSACKFYVEALQKISDPPIKKCPSCKKQTMKRLVSAPVFRLKGSGWYETDFKSDQENKRNLVGDDKDASSTDTDSSKSTSDKPATAKTEEKSETKKESTPTASSKSASKSNQKAPAAKRPAVKAKAVAKSKPAAKKK
jgi:putative FmdB family regulatory protein